ncbi:MAG: FliG C-terminal domain-containing protein [Planctomycetota bacterium]
MGHSGPEKVATLLLTLDRSTAAGLLKALPEMFRQVVIQALASMTDVFVPHAEQEGLLRQFHTDMLKSDGALLGSTDVCALLNEALGAEGETIADQVGSQDRGEHAKAVLERLDGQSLAFVLNDEHPQAVATILLEINSSVAATVLPKMPEELQQDVIERMVTMRRPPKELVTELLDAAAEKSKMLESVGEPSPENERLKTVATILNRFDEEAQQNLLMNLELNDPEKAQRVREQLFTFDDLVKLGPREVQRVLGGIDTKILATALKGASPEATIFLLGNVSKRTQDRVSEERETMGAVRLSEVRQAQQEMAGVARDLIQRGEIQYASGGEDELVT